MNKSELFSWSSTKRIILFIFISFYIYFAIALHLDISHLVTGHMPKLTGKIVLREYSIPFSILFVALIVFYLAVQLRRNEKVIRTIVYLFIYFVVVDFYYLFLSLHPVEIIHYVQYVILVILLGNLFDPKRKKFRYGIIIFTAASIGIIDELIQYYKIVAFHHYLDFNDMYLNCLGSVGGALIYYGFRKPPDVQLKPFYSTIRFYSMLLISSAVIFLILAGIIVTTPHTIIDPPSYVVNNSGITIYLERIPGKLGSWQLHFIKGVFYNTSPIEGIVLIISAMMLFSSYDERTFIPLKTLVKKYLVKVRHERKEIPKTNI